MKKFYAFAVAAVAALSMNAQTLYVCGAGDGLAWTPEAPFEVELTDGAYTFDVTNLTQLKLSTAMGDWDTFNAAGKTCNYTKDDLGNAIELVDGDGNIGTPWKGDYHIVIAGDLSTITMTTTTEEPTGPLKIYIRGAMNGEGWPAQPEWEFTKVEGNVYSFECKGETAIEPGVGFKIADADWDKINYGANGVVTFGEVLYWNYNDQDSTVAETFEGTIVITLPEEEKAELEVEFKQGVFSGVEAIEVAEGEAQYFNLQGVRVANPENGLYIVRQGSKVTKQVIR